MTDYLAKLRKTSLKRGYQETTIDFEFNRINDRKEIRKAQTENKEESIQTPLIPTYSQTLPNFRKVIENSRNLLKSTQN